MEEKERYELIGYCSYRDTKTGVIGDNFVELLNQQDQKIKELEKALELACEPRDDWGGEKYSGTEYDNYYDYFMAEAKEMLENESK